MSDNPHYSCKGRPTARSVPTAVSCAVHVIAGTLCCIVLWILAEMLLNMLRSHLKFCSCFYVKKCVPFCCPHSQLAWVCHVLVQLTFCGFGCACLSISSVRRPPQGPALLPNCVLMHGLIASRYCLIRVKFVFWWVHWSVSSEQAGRQAEWALGTTVKMVIIMVIVMVTNGCVRLYSMLFMFKK